MVHRLRRVGSVSGEKLVFIYDGLAVEGDL